MVERERERGRDIERERERQRIEFPKAMHIYFFPEKFLKFLS